MNKVETRVDALLNIKECAALDENQRARILHRLRNRINADGLLAVSCGETRSQKRNRRIAAERLIQLIGLALVRKKIRKKTGIPQSVKRKRLKHKQEQSEKKSRRGFRPGPSD